MFCFLNVCCISCQGTTCCRLKLHQASRLVFYIIFAEKATLRLTHAGSWILWLIGFRILHPRNANQRKVIVRFVYRDGYARYEWVDTRCGIRYQ